MPALRWRATNGRGAGPAAWRLAPAAWARPVALAAASTAPGRCGRLRGHHLPELALPIARGARSRDQRGPATCRFAAASFVPTPFEQPDEEHPQRSQAQRASGGRHRAEAVAALNKPPLRWQASTGRALDAGQLTVVRDFATDPRALRLGIGPAGCGKTTAMAALAAVLEAQGRRLVPLATSSKAAQVLGAELGMRAENLHKFLLELDRRDEPPPHAGSPSDDDRFFRLDRDTVVLVDEVSMAGTLLADRLTERAARAGATVRGLGDPHQLDAVEGGGWVRLVAHETGAAELTALHRFRDPAKATASLQLRAGDLAALDYYQHR
ncbi:MAG: AAA family ATPase, partial [Nocardioidaceae bacterium]